MNKYKTIGILGGMGPEATAELYKRIIRIYQSKGAVDDADFPNILINSVPVEDMLNDLDNRRELIVDQLKKAARVLEQAGADFIVVPCNTATLFLDEMQSSVSIPIINIIEVTIQIVQKLGSMKLGMLASTSTIENKIYEKMLTKLGITMLKPSVKDQLEVNQIIMRILSGNKRAADRAKLQQIAIQMNEIGMETLILGCTELPLLVSKLPGIVLIDTIQGLAEATVAAANSSKEIITKGV